MHPSPRDQLTESISTSYYREVPSVLHHKQKNRPIVTRYRPTEVKPIVRTSEHEFKIYVPTRSFNFRIITNANQCFIIFLELYHIVDIRISLNDETLHELPDDGAHCENAIRFH